MMPTLFPFQEAGVRFLLDPKPNPHKLLADEMGLGKTPQACVALRRAGVKSALIICPASIRRTWARRLVEWGVCSIDQIQIVESGKTILDAPFIVISYELAVALYKQLVGKTYGAIVCDEAQRLKTLDSKRSKKILAGGDKSLASRAYYKWLLSGTIMPNRPLELFPVCKTLFPDAIKPFTSLIDFGKRYCAGVLVNLGFAQTYNFKGASNIDELKTRLSPYMLRREIKEVYNQLPPVLRNTVYVDIGKLQVDESTDYLATIRRHVGLAKVPYVIQHVEDRLRDTPKLVIAAYHRQVCEALRDGLKAHNPVLIYGGVPGANRDNAIYAFVHDASTKIIIVQITSTGEGIDGLQTVCNNLILAELEWSCGLNDQLIGRLRRIGQQEKVYVTYVIAEHTLDEAMIGTYWQKKSVINAFNHTERNEMTIETYLDRIATALEKLTADAPTEQPQEQPKPEPGKRNTAKREKDIQSAGNAAPGDADVSNRTMDDVRAAALNALNRLGSGDAAKAEIKKAIAAVGKADQLANVEKHFWGALIIAFDALKPAATGDDF